MKYFPEI